MQLGPGVTTHRRGLHQLPQIQTAPMVQEKIEIGTAAEDLIESLYEEDQ